MTAEPVWAVVTGGPLRGHLMLQDPGMQWQQDMVDGRFDSFIYDAIEQWGRVAGATVWDVGAHFGYHTMSLAQLVGPSGRVVAFEPNRWNLARLALNLDRNPDLRQRAEVVDVALSDQDGEATFVFSRVIIDGTSSGSHLERAMVPSPAQEYELFERESVRTHRADTLWREGRVPAPDAIKIDVEGAESLVLQGARDLLRGVRPWLFVEVHNITQMFLVQGLLLGAGYRTEMLDPEHASVSRCFIVARPAA